MTQIHYFPRYSQKENFVTNNTLLLLYRLYSYNRFRFENFLSRLLRDADTEAGEAWELGLQIKQQISTGMSVIDGYLYQDSLRIAIETKLAGCSFTPDQLGRHLSSFTQSNGGFLILLSPERARIENGNWAKLSADAKAKNVVLVPVSFEDIITAGRGCLNGHEEEMQALLADYEDFCSGEGLLPIDRWTLFAPPCGRSHEINTTHKLYFCPASWSRRKARFLGVYYDRAVRHIGAIAKIVECEINGGNVVNETVPLTDTERCRIIAASQEALERLGWDLSQGYKFFLCDDMCETMFRKATRGGIMGHRYFDLRKYFPDDSSMELQKLAEHLRNKQWE